MPATAYVYVSEPLEDIAVPVVQLIGAEPPRRVIVWLPAG